MKHAALISVFCVLQLDEAVMFTNSIVTKFLIASGFLGLGRSAHVKLLDGTCSYWEGGFSQCVTGTNILDEYYTFLYLQICITCF